MSVAAAPLKPVFSLASPTSGIGYSPTDREIFVLEALHAPCTLQGVVAQLGALMRRGGVWYKHDPRLAMARNTLEAPADLTTPLDQRLPGESCPRVAKNFLNAPTCVRRPACAAVDYSRTTLPLSHATLRKFYEVGGVYLYALDGLRLEGEARVSPCHGESRWVSLHAPCGSKASHVGPATPLVSSSFPGNVLPEGLGARTLTIEEPVYRQQFEGFVPGCSALDMLMLHGPSTRDLLLTASRISCGSSPLAVWSATAT